MGFITDLFAPKVPDASKIAAGAGKNHKISETTTKLVGKPLTAIYGTAHVYGNAIYRRVSSNRKKIEQATALCWGPVDIDEESIRVNEKRPHYINGSLNPNRNVAPGLIEDVEVWTYRGRRGQSPAHGLKYGLNRTAYIFTRARANDDLSSINKVEATVTRDTLFTTAGDSDHYLTPIPAEIATAFPNGVRSSNVAAAALDYWLNKDYGVGKSISIFGDFATWIDAINACKSSLNVNQKGDYVGWHKLVRAEVLTEDGKVVRKGISSRAWNSGVVSRGSLKSGDGGVSFKVRDQNSIAYTESNKVCEDRTEYRRRGDEMNWPYTYRHCYTQVINRTAYENVIVGLRTNRRPGHHEGMKYAIHCKSDGAVEIFENGNKRSGLFGTWTTSDLFEIKVVGGNVVYYKNGSVITTSAFSTSYYPLYLGCDLYSRGRVAISTWDGSELEERFSIGMEVGRDDEDEHIDIVRRIMEIMHGACFQSNGVIKAWWARARTPVAAFDRSNFDPKGVQTLDRMEISNVVEIEYREERDRSEKRIVIWENRSAIDQWGEIRENREMHGIPTRMQAARTASFLGRKPIGEGLRMRGVADQRFFNLEPGDVVTATVGTYDATWFQNKPFWVDEINPDSQDGDVDLTLVEYPDESLFDDSHATVIDENDPIYDDDPSLRLISPFEIPNGPESFSHIIGEISRRPTKQMYVDLSWIEADEPDYMHASYQIYRRMSDLDSWALIDTIPGRTSGYRDYAPDLETQGHLYAVVPITSMGVSGELPEMFDHYVEPLSLDAPPIPQNGSTKVESNRTVKITWDYPMVPVDFDGYKVYASSGIIYDRATAIELTDGLTSERKLTTDRISIAGDWRIGIHAVDTYDNISDAHIIAFAMPSVPPASNLTAVGRVGGIELSWTPPANDVGLYYEIRDGETWDTAEPIVENHRSTNLFVPLSDPDDHMFFLRTKDQFGFYSVETLSVSSAIIAPDTVPAFIARQQDDKVVMKWDEVTGIGVKYEIRYGSNWDTAVKVATAGGNTYETIWPIQGTFVFWIKAVSNANLYSPDARYATTKIASLSDRNLLHERSDHLNGWPGKTGGFERIIVGGDDALRVIKVGGNNIAWASYYTTLTLPQRFTQARVSLLRSFGILTSDNETWDSATFNWESDNARRVWTTTSSLEGSERRALIAVDGIDPAVDYEPTLVEAWAFGTSFNGLIANTPPAISSGADGGFNRYGFVGLNLRNDHSTQVYDFPLPSNFTLLSDISNMFATTASVPFLQIEEISSGKIISLHIEQGSLILRTAGTFADNAIDPGVDWADLPGGDNAMKVGMSFDGDTIAVFAYNPYTASFGYQTMTLSSLGLTIGAIDRMTVARGEIGSDVMIGTIDNIELYDVAWAQADAEELRNKPHWRQIGYTFFEEYQQADYDLTNALIAIETTPELPGEEYLATQLTTQIDVPDIRDRGRASVLAQWTVIGYNKAFTADSVEVNVTPVSGIERAFPEIRTITKDSFEVRLVSRTTGSAVAGTISWSALGY